MTASEKPQLNPIVKIALDLGPLVLFFVANSRFGIFTATATFMVAVLAALAASYVLTRRLPIMPVVTAIIVLIFGGLTLILHNDTFIKIKPTIIYALFGAVLLGGLAVGKPLLGMAQADRALGFVLFGARGAQRDRLAQHLDEYLGRFQSVRRHAAHSGVRGAAISVAAKIRGHAGDRGRVNRITRRFTTRNNEG
jgi:hypothetical protein